jgi:hypothetical protein
MNASTTTIKYGLQHITTGDLVRHDRKPTEGSYCVAIQHEICFNGDYEWLVDDAHTAEAARTVSTPWYNAELETPLHGWKYKPAEYRVVRITITTVIEPAEVELN